MKILVISTPIFKLPCVGYAGLEHLAWLRAKHLAERGHEVALICPDGSQCPGVTIIPIGPERQVSEEQAYSKYWQYLPSFDVVIDESWQKHSYSLKSEGRLKSPVLGWMHAPIKTMYQTLPPGVDKPCFVCISEDQKNDFESFHGKPARCCRNGIDLQFYQSLDIPRTDRFLFLARFSSVKSPDLVQDICLAAGANLDMIGDTSITNEPDLLRKCQQKADGKQIRLVGPCSRGEAVFYYSQARAFIHYTPNFREPFGLAPVEAQACGLPVLGYRYGSLPEIVKHGETGFLVSSQQEAVELVKSNTLDTIDREACRSWAAQFSINVMIQRVEQLCQEALETGGW